MIEVSLVVNMSGAALFALVGIVILFPSRGRMRGLLVGSAAGTFGLAWVFENVGRPLSMVGLALSSGLSAFACLALAVHLVLPLSWRARAAMALIGVGASLAWVGLFLSGFGLYAAFLLALVVLTGAIAFAFRESAAASAALACLTRAEERHLTGLAEELGIGAPRAHELLVDAEAEAGVA